MSGAPVYVGCAGWKVGREYWPLFTGQGSHLELYARKLHAVELNSTFYRAHRPATYKKWASSVGADFRFSVKIPKSVTHENRLENCTDQLDVFLSQCCELGDRLGCLLIQLPPSLVFNPRIAGRFFEALRVRYSGYVVIEPRHTSWGDAQALLVEHHIAQAAVDPLRLGNDATPGGWPGFHYWRFHGSPRIYYSEYEQDWLMAKARDMLQANSDDSPIWCIFDNTARDAALGNALFMQHLMNDLKRSERK